MSKTLKDQFDRERARIYDERSMLLPKEDRPASKSVRPCFAKDKTNGFGCTKPFGHTDGHVAHGNLAQVIKRWWDRP